MPGGMISKAGYEHITAKGGGLEFYMQHGYVPYPLSDTTFGAHQDGAAMTLEYAYQDWTLAQLAKALNKADDHAYFLKRSANYRNLYNHTEGFIVPKDKKGNWNLPFDPLLYEHGFEEANGAHYLWFVPHDLNGLFDLMGGKDSAAKRLNREFEQTQPYRFCNEHPENMDEGIKEDMKGITSVGAPSRKYVNDKRTWINYSNQPSIQTAFIFNYAGYPWLTQYWSRMVVDSAYSKLSPYFGYNGDEDQGLMSSLSVLMKIGLFQMTGGCEADPVFEIGSPLFKKISIRLDPKFYHANSFVIETKNNSPANKYIQSASINNKDLNKYYFHQSDINKGGGLILLMDKTPNKKWGIGDPEN
jgi:predicted alpha-1,2-mannosidase